MSEMLEIRRYGQKRQDILDEYKETVRVEWGGYTSIYLKSILSDAQEEIRCGNFRRANQLINKTKLLIGRD